MNTKNKKIVSVIGIILIGIILVSCADIPKDTFQSKIDSGVDSAISSTGISPAASGPVTREIGDKEENLGQSVGLGEKRDSEITGRNVKMVTENGKTTITINDNGYVQLMVNGKPMRYENLKKLENVNFGREFPNTPQLTLDKTGAVTQAAFSVGKAGEYAFGNEKLQLPKDAKVFYKDGLLQVAVPEGTKVNAPEKIDSKKEGNNVEFKSAGKLKLFNDMEISGAKVHYINGELAISGKDIDFRGLKIRDTTEQIVYLDFSGRVRDVNGAYISLNEGEKTIVIGTNINKPGPAVMFSKDNVFGLMIEPTHFAVKPLGGDGVNSNYIFISDKNVVYDENGNKVQELVRSQKDLTTYGSFVGRVAINEDDRGMGTFLEEGKFHLKLDGRAISEFDDIKVTDASKTVPIEMHFYNKQGDKFVPLYNQDYSFVMGRNHELGWGPDPGFVKGSSYNAKYPLLARGVSNRISYNLVEYTKAGFEDYTRKTGHPISLSLDSYAASKMTPDQYRMLVDWYNTLPDNKANLRRITIDQTATMGGYSASAWGGPGHIEISYGSLSPGILRHEATHSATMSTSGFSGLWNSVGGGGGTSGLISRYATSNAGEHASEFNCYLMYDTAKSASLLQSNNYVRGQMSVMAKMGVISMSEYSYHMRNAGLDPSLMDKYIQEARR